MFKHLRSMLLVGLIASGSLLFAACADDGGDADNGDAGSDSGGTTAATEAAGDGDGGATTINVSMTEWAVTPSAANASAGEVTFNVSNDGTTPHDFMAIRTDMPADGLPVEAGQVVTDDLDVVAETEEFAAGEGGETSAELEAGNYVLICNIAGHYDLGMRTAFTVN